MKIRLPSIEFLARRLGDAVTNFPWVILCGIGCAGYGIYLHHNEYRFFETDRVATYLSLQLGLALFFALSYLFPRNALGKLGSLAAGLLLLGLHWFSFQFTTVLLYWYRFFQFALAAHLLVACLPIQAGRHGFWQFNRLLFLRFWLSALYSAVLYLGLCAALAAIHYLLNVKVEFEAYWYTFLVVALVFQTIFFCSGVPIDIAALKNRTDYPNGLRIFTQFLLVPLLTLYFVILYIYLTKIIVTMALPNGYVGWLVSGASLFGIFCLLLLDPIRESSENRWVRTFSRGFYPLLLPLLALLIFGLYVRVHNYGVTENRYFLGASAVWLCAISLYFIFSKSKDIIVVPVSLFFITFLTSFGPWGAYTVSSNSQLKQLTRLLEDAGAMVNGKFQKVKNPAGFEAMQRMSSILHYLDSRPEGTRLRNQVRVDVKDTSQSTDLSEWRTMQLLGLREVKEWETKERFHERSYSTQTMYMQVAPGGSPFGKVDVADTQGGGDLLHFQKRAFEVSVKGRSLHVQEVGSKNPVILDFDLLPILLKLKDQQDQDYGRLDPMTVLAQGGSFYPNHIKVDWVKSDIAKSKVKSVAGLLFLPR